MIELICIIIGGAGVICAAAFITMSDPRSDINKEPPDE